MHSIKEHAPRFEIIINRVQLNFHYRFNNIWVRDEFSERAKVRSFVRSLKFKLWQRTLQFSGNYLCFEKIGQAHINLLN